MTGLKTLAETRPERARAIAIICLGIGETLIWAALFYSFAALLLSWETDLGWEKSDLTLGLTVAIAVSALASPITGRIIDAGYTRWMFLVGGTIGAAAFACLIYAPTPLVFVLLWAVIGISQGACLYEPCFALVTRTTGADARKWITRITLMAGFASPISFPSGAYLASTYGWEVAVLVFAAVVIFIVVPLLFIGATLLEAAAGDHVTPKPKSENQAAVRSALRKSAFWLLAIAFPLVGLNHGMVLNHIVPLLVEKGLTLTLAVSAASIVGPMQVAGRIAMMTVEKRFSALTLTIISFCGTFVAALLLMVVGVEPLFAFAFAGLQGAAYGLLSILRPVIIADFLGRTAFGAISGLLAVPYLIGFAAAPHLASLIWEVGSYDMMIPVAAMMSALGAICIAAMAFLNKKSTQQ